MERRVYRYETVGSTNTELTELIRQGAAEGTVVLARQQTAGRGRMGRSFQSPAGLGLYGSVLLRSSPEDAPRIPALAATAVRRAIRRSCGLSCGIKWPNDLVLSGRKVCGILAEALPGPEGSLWVVVGIGINVCQRREDFLPELRETAASLSMIAGAEIDRAALDGLSGGTGGPAPGTAAGDGGAAAGVRSRLPESGPPGTGAAARRRAVSIGGVPDAGLRPCGAL